MAVGCLVQKCSAARQLQALTSIFATRLRLWNAGHSPTAAPNWILCGASQASRTADEVIEYGTRTSDIVHKAEVPSRPTHVSYRGLNGLQAEIIHSRLTHRLVPLMRAQLY